MASNKTASVCAFKYSEPSQALVGSLQRWGLIAEVVVCSLSVVAFAEVLRSSLASPGIVVAVWDDIDEELLPELKTFSDQFRRDLPTVIPLEPEGRFVTVRYYNSDRSVVITEYGCSSARITRPQWADMVSAIAVNHLKAHGQIFRQPIDQPDIGAKAATDLQAWIDHSASDIPEESTEKAATAHLVPDPRRPGLLRPWPSGGRGLFPSVFSAAAADAGPNDRSELSNEGCILWNMPDRMRVGQRERVEIRLGDAHVAENQLRAGLQGRAPPQIDQLEISSLMRVTIASDAKDFDVHALSTLDQYIRAAKVVRWDFDVRPLRAGRRTLRILVSMRLRVEGKDEVVDLPSYEREVRVRIAPLHTAGQFCGKKLAMDGRHGRRSYRHMVGDTQRTRHLDCATLRPSFVTPGSERANQGRALIWRHFWRCSRFFRLQEHTSSA
jgi:hypothetical protein